MNDSWTPVGVTSIRTPAGDLILQNAHGAKVSFAIRQRICDAINGLTERKPKPRLPSTEQLAAVLASASN